MRKQKLCSSVLVLLVPVVFPVAAKATLSYVRNPLHATVFVANDNGSAPHKVGIGRSPRVSPDGNWVAYLHEGPKFVQELKLAPAGGGAGKTLMKNFQEAFYLAWSPDSTMLAALRGPEIGKRNLVVVDLADGTQHVIASGYFSGFSFSPDSTEIVYSRSGSGRYPPHGDVFGSTRQFRGRRMSRLPSRSVSSATTARSTRFGGQTTRSSSPSCSAPSSAGTARKTSFT
jgi:Tol biopolymer transport system component